MEKTRTFGCSIKWSHKRDSAKKALERWANEDVSLYTIDEEGIGAGYSVETLDATTVCPASVRFP